MLHESGTGGAPKYGVVAQMPLVGSIKNPLTDRTDDTRASPDYTEVGYYKASLGSGTVVEMAASNKAGMYQYTFPETDKDLNVLVDVSHVLSSYRGQGLGQNYLNGSISVHDEPGLPDHYYYTGSGTYDNVSSFTLTSDQHSHPRFRDGIGLARGPCISVAISILRRHLRHLIALMITKP